MTDKIKLALELGKVNGAKALLAEYYKQEDKNKWLQEKQAEYDVLFPAMRLVTQEEYEADKDLGVNTEMPDWDDLEDEYKADLKCPIDYSEDESYVSFNEWLNETVVVTEAVEATYDEDGILLTEAVAEVTEPVRPYEPLDVTERVEAYLKPTVEANFRKLRDSYLVKCDIAINIAVDNGEDATELRALRQALRDATIEWIMPDVSILG